MSSSSVERVTVNHLVASSILALRVFNSIPQFDFSTLSIVLFSSLISAVFYYAFLVLKILPEVITVLKFRTKKLFKKNALNLNLVFLPNIFSYNLVVKNKRKK